MIKSDPLVTVLMSVYNGEKFLNEAIESILCQTFQDFEFLIINDGSTDNSQQCIESFHDDRIRVINKKNNIGLVGTLNRGLENSNGTYIARFDQDDISLPNRLKNQLKFLERNEECSAVSCWMITINSEGEKTHYFNQKIKNYGDFLGFILTGKVPLYHPAVMYRKSDVLSIDGYDTRFPMAEDYDLWRRMALNRFNGSIIKKYDLLQRQHSDNATRVHEAKYLESGYKVQSETIDTFSIIKDKKNSCLAALLRLSPDPCGKSYNKKHLEELVSHLNSNILENILKKMNMSSLEMKTLKKRIFKRLGIGVKYNKFFSFLPDPIYYPIITIISPLIKPNIYKLFFNSYRKFQKILLKFIR